MAAAGLSTVLYLARRVASFIHGIITLLLFFIFAIRDGSLVKRITEKEKNELALGPFPLSIPDFLWSTNISLLYSTGEALGSLQPPERVKTCLLCPLERCQASLRY